MRWGDKELVGTVALGFFPYVSESWQIVVSNRGFRLAADEWPHYQHDPYMTPAWPVWPFTMPSGVAQGWSIAHAHKRTSGLFRYAEARTASESDDVISVWARAKILAKYNILFLRGKVGLHTMKNVSMRSKMASISPACLRHNEIKN